MCSLLVSDLLAPVCEEDILHRGALHSYLENSFLQPGLSVSVLDMYLVNVCLVDRNSFYFTEILGVHFEESATF